MNIARLLKTNCQTGSLATDLQHLATEPLITSQLSLVQDFGLGDSKQLMVSTAQLPSAATSKRTHWQSFSNRAMRSVKAVDFFVSVSILACIGSISSSNKSSPTIDNLRWRIRDRYWIEASVLDLMKSGTGISSEAILQQGIQ